MNNAYFNYEWQETISGLSDSTLVWAYLDKAKAIAVQKLNFTPEQCKYLKQECDDLFFQATGNMICPSFWI